MNIIVATFVITFCSIGAIWHVVSHFKRDPGYVDFVRRLALSLMVVDILIFIFFCAMQESK